MKNKLKYNDKVNLFIETEPICEATQDNFTSNYHPILKVGEKANLFLEKVNKSQEEVVKHGDIVKIRCEGIITYNFLSVLPFNHLLFYNKDLNSNNQKWIIEKRNGEGEIFLGEGVSLKSVENNQYINFFQGNPHWYLKTADIQIYWHTKTTKELQKRLDLEAEVINLREEKDKKIKELERLLQEEKVEIPPKN